MLEMVGRLFPGWYSSAERLTTVAVVHGDPVVLPTALFGAAAAIGRLCAIQLSRAQARLLPFRSRCRFCSCRRVVAGCRSHAVVVTPWVGYAP